MARFRQFTKRQQQQFLVQKVPTLYTIVDKTLKWLIIISHDKVI
jgi:hypothetical protein